MTDQPTKKGRPDIGPRLTDRDMETLQWIAEQYAIAIDHLQILLNRLRDPELTGPETKEEGTLTEKRALKIVRRWQTMGLAERKHIMHGEPQWVWLTPLGLKLVEEETGEFRSYTPNAATINHLYWTNHARLFVEQKRPNDGWISERELRASQEKTQAGVKRPHTPDALVVTEKGKKIAVEIELSTKIQTRLEKILEELATSEYNTVWYFVQGRVKKLVEKAVADSQHPNKFAVYDFDDIPLE